MQAVLLVLLILVSVFLVVLILVQQGKGAEIGAAFGSGASQTIFGSQGSGSFLFKVTCIFAALFFGLCLVLNYLALRDMRAANSTAPVPVSTAPEIPAQPQPLSQTQENGLSNSDLNNNQQPQEKNNLPSSSESKTDSQSVDKKR